MGGVDNQRGASVEMSYFVTKRLCVNFKENSSFGWKTKVAVEI